MILRSRLKKIEANIKDRERENYRYIFGTHEEYEQAKLNGETDPQGGRVLILDDLEKEE